MHLYHHSLLPSSSITASCVGNFSGTKQQDILLVRGGTRLELLRTDAQTGKLDSVVEAESFGQIRSIAPFKLTGGAKGINSFLLLPFARSRMEADSVPVSRLYHLGIRFWKNRSFGIRCYEQRIQQTSSRDLW